MSLQNQRHLLPVHTKPDGELTDRGASLVRHHQVRLIRLGEMLTHLHEGLSQFNMLTDGQMDQPLQALSVLPMVCVGSQEPDQSVPGARPQGGHCRVGAVV